MRVLFFYFTAFGSVGGVETVILKLARGLAERHHDAGLIDFAESWRGRRCTYEDVPMWSIATPSRPTIRRPRSWASYLRTLSQFETVSREFRPDIVHVHFPLAQCLPVTGAHALPHSWRLVTTVHGSEIRVSAKSDSHVQAWQARLFQRSDAVTSVSRSLLDETTSLYPCVSQKGRVIYNGVDEWWFRDAEAELDIAREYILFVGRLHDAKGVDVLLRAWRIAGPQLVGTDLLVVGSGPERDKLEALTRELGIQASVKFLGQRPPAELKSLYRAAKFVVLPSRREGLPMVLLEAGACGAITVGTCVGGTMETIVDGITGFLVAAESPDALAETMIRTANLPLEDRQRMSRDAQDRVRTTFTQARMVSEYILLYRSLLDKKVTSELGTVTNTR